MNWNAQTEHCDQRSVEHERDLWWVQMEVVAADEAPLRVREILLMLQAVE